MVLHAHQIEPDLVCDQSHVQRPRLIHRGRDDEDAEVQFATVVQVYFNPSNWISSPSPYVRPPTITPASVISRPADHLLRSVKSDFAAPTRKWATSETMKATTTPVVPRRKKKGITGTIAPTNVLMPAASADCTGSAPPSAPPSSSVTWALSIVCGSRATLSASMVAVSASMPLS